MIDVFFRDGRVGDEVKKPLERQHRHVLAPEKLVDVVAVFAKKLEGVWMIHFDGLRKEE